MVNSTQDSFPTSEFIPLEGKLDQFDNSFRLLSTISSANFDGAIPENILFYPDASILAILIAVSIVEIDCFTSSVWG